MDGHTWCTTDSKELCRELFGREFVPLVRQLSHGNIEFRVLRRLGCFLNLQRGLTRSMESRSVLVHALPAENNHNVCDYDGDDVSAATIAGDTVIYVDTLAKRHRLSTSVPVDTNIWCRIRFGWRFLDVEICVSL